VQFPPSYPGSQPGAGAPVSAYGQPATYGQAPPPGFAPQQGFAPPYPGQQPGMTPPPGNFAAAAPGFPPQGAFPPGQYAQPAPAPQRSPQQAQSPAQQAQQAYQQRLIGVARTLEQLFPDYQVLVSMFSEIFNSPAGQTISGAEPLMGTLKELTFCHTAVLGAIRRFLYGEATPIVLSDMAVCTMQLGRIHSQIQPLIDRLILSAGPDMRGPLNGLAQNFASSGLHLSQATQAMQATVGPQIWEAAQEKVNGK
jgi:hypothetical protein